MRTADRPARGLLDESGLKFLFFVLSILDIIIGLGNYIFSEVVAIVFSAILFNSVVQENTIWPSAVAQGVALSFLAAPMVGWFLYWQKKSILAACVFMFPIFILMVSIGVFSVATRHLHNDRFPKTQHFESQFQDRPGSGP